MPLAGDVCDKAKRCRKVRWRGVEGVGGGARAESVPAEVRIIFSRKSRVKRAKRNSSLFTACLAA